MHHGVAGHSETFILIVFCQTSASHLDSGVLQRQLPLDVCILEQRRVRGQPAPMADELGQRMLCLRLLLRLLRLQLRIARLRAVI